MNSLKQQRIQLYAAMPQPCSYLPTRIATNAFVDPGFTPDAQDYQALIDLGFRRSGNYLYRPSCDACQACMASRIVVADFHPDRSQRRCWKRNQDLQVTLTQAHYSDEYFELYQRYLSDRHAGGGMDNPSADSFGEFLFASWSRTRFIEFRNAEQKLLGVAVIDELPAGYSAIYTFFDTTEYRRSLGTYAILYQIHLAQTQSYPYVYLGYWIAESEKMAYKANFQTLQVYTQGQWQAKTDL